MGSNSMADISGLLGSNSITTPKHTTSRKNNTELDMMDFLQLMIVQLQNQTIDDTMDTSEMMNQMIQMQMVTAISNMTETSVQSYASSLVGKVVTIGIVTDKGLEEREVLVTGTGVMNGQQVIFGKDANGKVETYGLNQIMAVGQLPPIEKPGEGEEPGEGEGEGEGGVDGLLRDRPHGAGGGVSQVVPAAPHGGALPGGSAVEGLPASCAVHLPGQRVDAVGTVLAMLFSLPESLDLLKGLPADDGGMGALDINLVHFAVVDLLREREAGFIGLLAERVADVFFVR